jgi:hypothetical protein
MNDIEIDCSFRVDFDAHFMLNVPKRIDYLNKKMF